MSSWVPIGWFPGQWSVHLPPIGQTHHCPGTGHSHPRHLSTTLTFRRHGWQGLAEKLMHRALQHVSRWKSFVSASCPGDNMVMSDRLFLRHALPCHHHLRRQSCIKEITKCSANNKSKQWTLKQIDLSKSTINGWLPLNFFDRLLFHKLGSF